MNQVLVIMNTSNTNREKDMKYAVPTREVLYVDSVRS